MGQLELDLVRAGEGNAPHADHQHDLRAIIADQIYGRRRIVGIENGHADGHSRKQAGMNILHGKSPGVESMKPQASQPAATSSEQASHSSRLIISNLVLPPHTRL